MQKSKDFDLMHANKIKMPETFEIGHGFHAEILHPGWPDTEYPKFGLKIHSTHPAEKTAERLLTGNAWEKVKGLTDRFGFWIMHTLVDDQIFRIKHGERELLWVQVRNREPGGLQQSLHADKSGAHNLLLCNLSAARIPRTYKSIVCGASAGMKAVSDNAQILLDAMRRNDIWRGELEKNIQYIEYARTKPYGQEKWNAYQVGVRGFHHPSYDPKPPLGEFQRRVTETLTQRRLAHIQSWETFGQMMGISGSILHAQIPSPTGKDDGSELLQALTFY